MNLYTYSVKLMFAIQRFDYNMTLPISSHSPLDIKTQLIPTNYKFIYWAKPYICSSSYSVALWSSSIMTSISYS